MVLKILFCCVNCLLLAGFKISVEHIFPKKFILLGNSFTSKKSKPFYGGLSSDGTLSHYSVLKILLSSVNSLLQRVIIIKLRFLIFNLCKSFVKSKRNILS